MKLIRNLCLGATLLASSAFSASNWELNQELSTISFQTTKNGAIVENHTLNLGSGTITPSGEATVTIELNSVQTGIDIRNERMREILFQTSQFPLATVSQKLNLDDYPEGKPVIKNISAELSLHGIKKPIELKLSVIKLENTVNVNSVEPVLLNAAEFNLEEGIDQLKTMATLDSIAKTVPVSISMVFER